MDSARTEKQRSHEVATEKTEGPIARFHEVTLKNDDIAYALINREYGLAEMRRSAPSVFASQPIEGVSERYRFLPTSSILSGMRENGWVPVRAQEQSIRTEARRGFRNTLFGLLVLSISRAGKRTKSGPRSFW
jgi:hypothetical protein